MARIVAASPGPDVLDAGCGTGIAARPFQAAGCGRFTMNNTTLAVTAARATTP